jgi:hypothetical protein
MGPLTRVLASHEAVNGPPAVADSAVTTRLIPIRHDGRPQDGALRRKCVLLLNALFIRRIGRVANANRS